MWAVTNETRFKVERTFARDADGECSKQRAGLWLRGHRETEFLGFMPDGLDHRRSSINILVIHALDQLLTLARGAHLPKRPFVSGCTA